MPEIYFFEDSASDAVIFSTVYFNEVVSAVDGATGLG